jgi:hypothetical protein
MLLDVLVIEKLPERHLRHRRIAHAPYVLDQLSQLAIETLLRTTHDRANNVSGGDDERARDFYFVPELAEGGRRGVARRGEARNSFPRPPR